MMKEERGEEVGGFPLPEDIVRTVMGGAEVGARFARDILRDAARVAEDVRARLQKEGKLRRVGDVPPFCNPKEVEGVDGSWYLLRMASFDMVLCAAVAIGRDIDHEVRTIFAPHSQYLSVASQGITTMLELSLAAASKAPLVVHDGSFISSLTRVNASLAARDFHSEDGLWASVDPVYGGLTEGGDWFSRILRSGRVIATPKYSTTSHFVELNLPELKSKFSDRSLFSLILRPGEFVQDTRTYAEYGTNLARESRFRPPDADEVESFFDNEGFFEVFYRPHPWSAAYRIELPMSFDRAAVPSVLQTFKALLPDPSMLEPYPQWLSDALCKQIGVAGAALRDAMESILSKEGFDIRTVHAALGGYRTGSGSSGGG